VARAGALIQSTVLRACQRTIVTHFAATGEAQRQTAIHRHFLRILLGSIETPLPNVAAMNEQFWRGTGGLDRLRAVPSALGSLWQVLDAERFQLQQVAAMETPLAPELRGPVMSGKSAGGAALTTLFCLVALGSGWSTAAATARFIGGFPAAVLFATGPWSAAIFLPLSLMLVHDFGRQRF